MSQKMRRHRASSKSEQGLALVEVLVAVMILASSSVFVLQALSRTAVLEREIRNLGRAQYFAADKMAQIEALAVSGKEMKDKQQGSFTEGEQLFHWQMRAKPASQASGLKQVTLDVSWKQGQEDYQRRVQGWVPYPEPEEETL